MPVTPTYPGVYIEELSGLSLSISHSPTAVPVFACGKTIPPPAGASAALEKKYIKHFETAKRVNSWLDFTQLMTELDPKEINDPNGGTEKIKVFDFKKTDNLYLSMQTYFQNGGGYCYIVDISKLETEVPKLDDVTLIVAAGEDIKGKVATLCPKNGTCFAILDGPKPLETLKTVTVEEYTKNAYAAAYYPWLNAKWADSNPIPPSAAVAGAYCRVDIERGVWKAPANVELNGGVTPAVKVSDEDQAAYMGDDKPSINMIRQFRGTGTTIWGARTLDTSGNWKYIPVRRLFNTAERDIKKAMSVAMFEPNSQPTWEKVRAAIDHYLYGIWKQGGLTGNTEKEAYFVQIGKGITMTQTDIDQGKMIVKIGMAAVRPAEFIILQFTQDMVQS
ncbi:hypothetical protein BGZ92_007191 [Podila epicladia]|nr:hypothetical protein BGZ92_007191 [Podila epicladia]